MIRLLTPKSDKRNRNGWLFLELLMLFFCLKKVLIKNCVVRVHLQFLFSPDSFDSKKLVPEAKDLVVSLEKPGSE